ncbi:MAG TPA: GAF domain-containing protein, partial [Verrucomicrobiae bacterium]
MLRKPNQWALKLSLVFMGVAGAWSLLSDELLNYFTDELDTFRQLDATKDFAFIFLMGSVIYFLARRHAQALEVETEQRKKAEAALHPKERTLRMITACHHAMLRASDENALLQEVCQVAISEGDYRLAWVAFPKHDEFKSFACQASAGHVAGYLDKLEISWDPQRPESQGPCGTTYLTGIVTAINNLNTDPRFRQWQHITQPRGYASAIGLPLRDQHSCFGVLMIYSSAPEA